MKLHNLLLIMAAIFAVIQLATDQFPHLAMLFNVIGVGTLIPLFFVLLASFKQARKDRITWLWFVALAILTVVAFTFIRDWGPVWPRLVPPTPTPPFDNQISV
jgi:amino acid transporter